MDLSTKKLHNTDSDSIDYEKKKKKITVTPKVANPFFKV